MKLKQERIDSLIVGPSSRLVQWTGTVVEFKLADLNTRQPTINSFVAIFSFFLLVATRTHMQKIQAIPRTLFAGAIAIAIAIDV